MTVEMHRFVRWLGLCTLPLLSLTVQAEPLDRVVAVVNDSVILQSDLDREITLAQSTMRQHGIDPPDARALQAQVLEHIIVTRLQVEEAKHDGIKVDDKELNEALTRVADQNHMTVGVFAEKLKADGIDFNSLRHAVRDEVTIEHLRSKEVATRIFVSDEDVDLYLANNADADQAQYQVSHILVAVPDNASPAVRAKAHKKADDLLAKLKAGGDFTQLAIKNSDGQQALQGGDMGWKHPSELPTLFAHLVPAMHEGDVSDVLEDAAGFHIVKLVARKSATGRAMVEETHARHILLRPNAIRDEKATHALIDSISAQLKAGANFADLAKKYSEDPGSHAAGGDLGWEPPGTFAPDFETQLGLLKPGQISAPFRTSFGWHIAQVLERRTRDATDENRRNDARQAIFLRREQDEYEDYVRRLRSEAYVEYRLSDESSPASGSTS
jgi:peptidyl-prolyl cis-trans isomerase SurA